MRAAAVLLCGVFAGVAGRQQQWVYGEVPGRGPSSWSTVGGGFPACAAGDKGSPIALGNTTIDGTLDPLTTDYDTAVDDYTISNTRFTCLVNFPTSPGKASVGSSSWDLKEIQIRVPAEHTVHGVRHDMELQLKHEAGDATAMVSILLSVGASNRWVKRILEELRPTIDPNHQYYANQADDQPDQVSDNAYRVRRRTDWTTLSVADIVPGTGYYKYTGTETIPPCGSATWYVMTTVGTISAEELSYFETQLSYANWKTVAESQTGTPATPRLVKFGNYRPIQATVSQGVTRYEPMTEITGTSNNDRAGWKLGLASVMTGAIAFVAVLAYAGYSMAAK